MASYFIENYSIIQPLTQNQSCDLYKAVDTLNHGACILKTARRGDILALAQQSLQREFSILSELDHVGITKPIRFIERINQSTLVLEDQNEILLEAFLTLSKLSKLPINEFYLIALQLCEILGYIHRKKIIHRNINLNNILINPRTLKVRLIDFSLSTKVTQQHVTQLLHPNQMEGDLDYISPEQTGRMNRSYDYRTDFYSLGVCFYKMLTGTFPFKSEDTIGLIYAHLTEKPKDIHKMNPNVPASLAHIIAKCLEKTPEERYQSAYGLKTDLSISHELYQQDNLTKTFTLGKKDIPSHFQLSDKIYGREQEVEKLLSAFELAKTNPMSLMLVSGNSGVGKTLLVQELYKPLTEKNSIFIAGKFDQYQVVSPYVAWIQALENLMQYILSLNKNEFEIIKERINKAIYPNGQVIINLVPSLEKVIGKQPKVLTGNPEQEKNRFYYVFNQFISTFCTADRPLVIYLDDWQWADQPSIRLLEVLCTQYKPMNILCICAYRKNEVTSSHLFNVMIEKVKTKNVSVSEVTVSELAMEDVCKMLMDSLHETSNKKIQSIAQLIYDKTHGNPFFMIQYLKMLNHENALYFDEKKGHWTWSIEEANDIVVTNDVVSLMINALKTLSSDVQHLLQLAACIGNRFDLSMLSDIAQMSEADLIKRLFPALSQGFIMLNDVHDTTGELYTGHNSYKFSHDKLQQAAYEMIPKEERELLHYKMATLLCKNITKGTLEKRIFQIVNHFIFSEKLFSTDKAKWKFVKLNMIAGKMAMKAIAFKPALKYFDAALRNIGADSWKKHYHLTFNLHKNICECAYVNFDFDLATIIANQALKNLRNLHEKFYIYGIIVSSLNAQSKPLEAIDTTWEVVKMAGIVLPYETTLPRLSFMIMRMYWHFYGNNYESLINRPLSADPLHSAAIDLLTRSLAPFYAVRDPYIIVYTGCRVFVEILTKGFTPSAPLVIVAFSIIFCMFRDFKRAMMLADIALHLLPEDKDKWKFAFTKTVYAAFIMPWQFPFDKCIEDLKSTHQVALQIGHLEAAALCNYWEVNSLRFKGTSIVKLREIITQYYHDNVKIGQHFISNAFQIQLQVMENLSNNDPYPWVLNGNHLNEKEALSRYKATKDIGMLKHFYYNKFLVACLFGQDKVAYHAILRGNLIREEREPGSFENAYCNTLIVITLSHLYPKVKFKHKVKLLKHIFYFLHALKSQAKQNPTNFEHLYQLANAHYYAMKNKNRLAEDWFLKAKLSSLKNDYKFEYARVCELIGNFYLQNKQVHLAFLNLSEAAKTFNDLTVLNKANEVIRTHRTLLSDMYQMILPNQSLMEQLKLPMQTSSTTENVISTSSTNLDILTITKVSQALSNDIILPRLIERVMYSILENIGAERCVLLLNEDKQLFVEGSLRKHQAPKNILSAIKLEDYPNLPASLIAYVFRSEDHVLISSDEDKKLFADDPYFKHHSPASILCTPILYQKKCVGIFYFENRATSQIFRKEAVETIKLLSPQIAISIQNAILYSSFERFVPMDFLKLLGKESLLNIKKGDCINLKSAILFMDLRNFTRLSENLKPKEVFTLLNDFFGYTTPVITKHLGFIDKYIGDAVMAIFPESADSAVEAAIELRRAITDFNQSKKYPNEIEAGIGIHTGFTILGTIGDKNRLDVSVVSDTVNTASRVEDLHKIYGSSLLITHETYESLKNKNKYMVRLIDKVMVKGKDQVIQLYQVINAEEECERILLSQICNDFAIAWHLYQSRQFDEAISHLENILKTYPEDKCTKLLLKRCEKFLRYPPSETWNGAMNIEQIDNI